MLKQKRNKGFTLVELLAVIVILAIILVIAVPKVMSIIEDSKKATIEASARQILQYAENQYLENKTMGIDENITCNDIAKISNEDYEICKIEFVNDVARLTIKGSGKFNGLYICKNKKNTVEAVEECNMDKTSIELTLQKNDGTEDIIETYEEGTIIELETLAREGYIFEGWEVVKGDSVISDNQLTIGSEDTIVYAAWKRNTLITIDYDNGEENCSNRHITNTTINLEIPEKENYKFVRWELVSGNSVLSGNSLTIGTEDTTIKAIWELNLFNLSIDLDGGSVSESKEGIYKVGEIIELIQPIKTGYTFDKWEIVSGNDASVTLNTLIMGKEDTKVKAKYKANTYQINYDLDGGILGVDSPISAEYGNTIELVNPSKIGYEFAGWTVSEGALLSGNKLTIGANNVTLTSRWTPITYNISYELNGGEKGINSPTATTFDSYVKIPEPLREISVVGDANNTGANIGTETSKLQKFIGWTANSGINVNYAKTGTTNETKDSWNGNLTTNEYFKNLSTEAGTAVLEANWESVAFNIPSISKTGYTCSYNTNKDGSGTKYDSEALYKPDLTTNTVTLYAICNVNSYKITYELNGGTKGNNAPEGGNYNEVLDVSNPSKQGYTFTGWTLSGTGAEIKDGKLTIGTSDVKLTASWQINTYQITYELGGGTLGTGSPTNGEFGKTINLVNPSRTGYTFGGWTVSEGALLSGNSLTIGASDVTITAKWIANTNTAYVVKHWIQNLGADTIQNSTNYTLNSTENKTGTTDSNVTPAIKNITGFTAPSTQTKTIAGDGSLVLNYYYTRNSYTFTLGSNAGVNTSGSTVSGSYQYGTTITLKASVNAGYSWSKWTTGNTSLVGDKTELNTTFTMPAGNITMTPNVTANTYTISYSLGGGNASNKDKYTVETETFTLNNPSKTGYTFTGWTGSNGNTPSKSVTISKGTTGNKEYTANYSINTYTINYELDGGTLGEGSPTSGEYGSVITLVTPTKKGWTFAGWFVSGTGATLSGNKLTIGSEDVILTANWKIKFTDHITNILASESTLNNGLFIDDTTDQNIRYVGANPNNKAYFNCKDKDSNNVSYGEENYDYANSCEVWRIIGVFNTKTSANDTEGAKRVKIVRDAFTDASGNVIGMSWDSSSAGDSGIENNKGYGINQWGASGNYEGADLMRMLNGYYIGVEGATCTYCNGENQGTCENDCSSSVTPLSSTSVNMIDNALWYTGTTKYNLTQPLSSMYEGERSTRSGKLCTSGNGCNDIVTRTTTWTGKIGLIYPSDYGYASTDASCASNIVGRDSTCGNNNWLHPSSGKYFAISPGDGKNFAYRVWLVNATSSAGINFARHAYQVRPTVYLDSNIQITGGDGNTIPFKLAT